MREPGVNMRRRLAERGVALPLVILIIVVLTVLLAAGFSGLASERRVRPTDQAALGAFTLAETGLELLIARRDSFGFSVAPPAVTESTRIVLTGGYADVVLQQLRADATAQRWGYVVRSHGVSTVQALRGTPAAERTVAEYAVWQPATINILSSWTSLSGLHKSGGSSMGAGGTDGCGQLTAVAGVALTMNGNVTWRGVLLVGDNLTSNGNGGVDGATVTGLNVKLGKSLSQDDVGNGAKRFNYNSCNVAKAMGKTAQLVGYTNAWVDNWPTY